MKQILNKKSRDFKDKVELINALTTKYFEMKNYGIDLNDIAKVEKNVKQPKIRPMKENINFCVF